ncbi:LPS export ABC transporter periplasmic protein LptC [Halarcobacter sp.]|uniref:LPS export ABC transporter periplasmic protein LptC n=1 Tax=Halarcobacter sp. TaxID=2321133 RepID=UPI002AA74FE2|nr:LPS export ABC transporter periplasmic protein LptC [Halarcobacter sp.]
MVIRIFVFVLFSLSVIGYFMPVEQRAKKDADKDRPLLTFVDSTMYTLNTDSMNRIIFTKEAIRYKNRDVMHDGSLMLKSIDNDNQEITDTLLADLIIKRGDNFKFINDVQFTRNDYMTLNTNELLYNAETKIATNTLPFEGTYFNNYLEGENMYLDLNNYYMNALKTHFEIEIEKKGN